MPNGEKRGDDAGNAATAGCTCVSAGIEILAALVLSVCAGWGQLIAQQSRAAATAGVSTCICANRQQSIIPGSVECSGTPASTLPPSARTSAKAESRFIIANRTI